MPLLTRHVRTADRLGRSPRAAAVLSAGRSLATVPRLAGGRTAIGVVMVARPALVPGLLGVDSATSTRMAWSTQMLGAREIALGLGTLVAARRSSGSGDRALRLWLLAGTLADGIDAVAVSAALAKGQVSRVPGAAVVATALGALAVQGGEVARR